MDKHTLSKYIVSSLNAYVVCLGTKWVVVGYQMGTKCGYKC